MSKAFKGRVIIPGNVEGEALVTHTGFNILASFQKSLVTKSKKAICSDQNNKDLYKKNLTGKILCLPQTIGSTTGGLALQTAAQMGITPKALLFSKHIDSLAASGIILADIWLKKRIVTIDQLTNEFLQAVQEGQWIEIQEGGTVIVK